MLIMLKRKENCNSSIDNIFTLIFFQLLPNDVAILDSTIVILFLIFNLGLLSQVDQVTVIDGYCFHRSVTLLKACL
jgi:hypothetical protein